MKTKELIKMLKEEDPSGEGYVRINGGAILCCEAKEGYWDGMYQYYKDGVWYMSANNYKIDIHTISWEDIVWDCEGNMEKIKTKLKPDFSMYLNKDEKEKKFWETVEKEAIEAKDCSDKLNNEMYEQVFNKLNDGWEFLFPLDCETIHGKWVKGNKQESPCCGEIKILNENKEKIIKNKK